MTKKNIILILLISSNCILYGSSNNQKKGHEQNFDQRFRNAGSKFLYKIKPSESMQAGIPKESLKDSYDEYEDPDDYLKISRYGSDNYENYSSSEEIYKNQDPYLGNFKIGKPYSVFGISYSPKEYESFKEFGTASWYGDEFNGKITANGEIYNKGDLTAAHPTLPLSSIVRITNLYNDKSVIVKVNDRGPFAKSRIIDVSERAADILGFKDRGTTEVKVEVLTSDTTEMLDSMKLRN